MTTKKNRILDSIIATIFFGVSAAFIYVCYQNQDKFFQIANDTFQITKQELCYLPIGILVFLFFYYEMKDCFFGPLINLMNERECATTGATQHAKELDKNTARMEEDYNYCLNNARLEALKEENIVLQQAQKDADEKFKAAQVEIEAHLSNIQLELEKNTISLQQELILTRQELTESIVKSLQSGVIQ